MKIYGKEHDYYDCALAYGQDPLCVWKRKFNKFESIHHKESFNIPDTVKIDSCHVPHGSSFILYEGYVFFCGKLYPFLEVVADVGFIRQEHICYDIDSLKKYLYSIRKEEEVDNYFKHTNWRRYSAEDKILDFFNVDKYDMKIEDLHRINNVPVYIYFNGDLYEGGSLKDFHFQKVKDPYTCFQEINQYISGVLGGQSPKLVEIEDKYKIEGKGFDRVTSFRNMKRGGTK